MPQGRGPASTEPTTLFVAVSTNSTILLRPVLTYTNLPSGDITVPIARMPMPRSIDLTTLSLFASMTVSDAPVSDGTYARDPSGRNATVRGRGPVLTDLTTFLAARSMTNTPPASSDVTHTRAPEGSTETPSGSSPTLMRSEISPAARSMMLSCAASSLEM